VELCWIADEEKATSALLKENEMHQFWKSFALVVSVGFVSQAATAETSHPIKCQIQVELTEAAEMQLGGGLYSGPKLTPEEIMANMKTAHQVHHPQHGGAFFMAPNKMNHLEVIYSNACGARVYMYNAFTKPIRADRFLAFVEFVPLGDEQFEVIRFMQPSKDGNYLRTDANHGVEPPFDIRLFMKFPDSDQVELFTVKLEPARPQLVEGIGIVVEIDRRSGKLVINHTAIPGYMGAMTMPYAVSSPNVLDHIEPEMQIKFIIDREKDIIVKIDPIVG
jgi:Cu/Ag efflux protein CusF